MRKYQKVEQSNVVSPQGHKVVEDELRKTGSKSVQDLPEDKRHAITEKLTDSK